MEYNKNDIANYIGMQIYKIRKENRLSREQFAEKTDLSPNYIYEMEKGKSIPSCIALINICNAFNVAPSAILGKYLNINVNTASELINSNFEILSNYDKNLVIDVINFLADRSK